MCVCVCVCVCVFVCACACVFDRERERSGANLGPNVESTLAPARYRGTLFLMSEVPLYYIGHLAHKKQPPLMNLQLGFEMGHMLVPRGGGAVFVGVNSCACQVQEGHRLQGYLAHKEPITGAPRSQETTSSADPTVGLCIGPYVGPRGGRCSTASTRLQLEDNRSDIGI